ncbi:hypothetical protein LSH36_661g00000 [Paralvinella palmiformis]|uniref:NADAR domain-containing protein n=1 Tax=Paralvinella palmiformis TaxID=53620 RepID=A0AAD9J4Z5_9ANNE|nr:hypothetical protein LSH36_661g00000 [Paralvinella palmiformis]
MWWCHRVVGGAQGDGLAKEITPQQCMPALKPGSENTATYRMSYTRKLQAVERWKATEVKKWLEETELDFMKSRLKDISGPEVVELRMMLDTAPEYFYRSFLENKDLSIDKIVNYINAAIAALSKIFAKDKNIISELTAENTMLKESLNMMTLQQTRCLRVFLIWNRKKRNEGDWDDPGKVLSLMARMIAEKVRQNPYLKAVLLSTGSRELAEANHYDSYWGIGSSAETAISRNSRWPGNNTKGKILVDAMNLLRDETQKLE